MQNKRFGALSSSIDGNSLSATVSGLILSFGAIIIVVMNHFGVPFTDTQVASLAANAGLAAGALWTLYGLIRKAVVFFATVRA